MDESRVWVSQISGHIYMNPSVEVRKEEWKTFDIDASLSGIWGLSDKLVFTWGLKGQKPVMYLYEGKRWKKIEVPGHIGAVRGIREDLIYAVGLGGLIARFDGRRFEAVDNPSSGNLCDVFVASEEEMYACGLDGHLLRGSVKGWDRLLRFDGALHCVAKWGDTVWLGAGPDGVFALEKRKLALRKETVKAEEFDARGNLLAACPLAIVETTDGKDWVGTVIDVFEELSEPDKPHWTDMDY